VGRATDRRESGLGFKMSVERVWLKVGVANGGRGLMAGVAQGGRGLMAGVAKGGHC
jgi:hypothetical protein